MSEKPEALRLAKILETEATHSIALDLEAAAELRRLFDLAFEQHSEIYGLRLKTKRLEALNTGLLEALGWIADRCPVHLADHPLHDIHKEMAHDAGACARAAIAKVKGESK